MHDQSNSFTPDCTYTLDSHFSIPPPRRPPSNLLPPNLPLLYQRSKSLTPLRNHTGKQVLANRHIASARQSAEAPWQVRVCVSLAPVFVPIFYICSLSGECCKSECRTRAAPCCEADFVGSGSRCCVSCARARVGFLLLSATDLVCDCYLSFGWRRVGIFAFAPFVCFCVNFHCICGWLRRKDEARHEAAVEKVESGQEVVWEEGVEGQEGGFGVGACTGERVGSWCFV